MQGQSQIQQNGNRPLAINEKENTNENKENNNINEGTNPYFQLENKYNTIYPYQTYFNQNVFQNQHNLNNNEANGDLDMK